MPVITPSRPQDAAARARGLAAIAEAREPRPTVVQTCNRCGLDVPHKLLKCGRPRVPCVSCRIIVDEELRKGLRAPRRQKQRCDIGMPRTPRIARTPPELGAVVTLDCSPPEQGVVERIDLNRKLVYVRTRHGALPYGFAEIKRGKQ